MAIVICNVFPGSHYISVSSMHLQARQFSFTAGEKKLKVAGRKRAGTGPGRIKLHRLLQERKRHAKMPVGWLLCPHECIILAGREAGPTVWSSVTIKLDAFESLFQNSDFYFILTITKCRSLHPFKSRSFPLTQDNDTQFVFQMTENFISHQTGSEVFFSLQFTFSEDMMAWLLGSCVFNWNLFCRSPHRTSYSLHGQKSEGYSASS